LEQKLSKLRTPLSSTRSLSTGCIQLDSFTKQEEDYPRLTINVPSSFTRAQKQQALKHVLENVLGKNDQSMMTVSLTQADVNDIIGLMSLSDSDISTLNEEQDTIQDNETDTQFVPGDPRRLLSSSMSKSPKAPKVHQKDSDTIQYGGKTCQDS
jgi:chromosomal replication initiation ATPase DnaA